jgi:tetratricopeptide (TPR) repeat protein
VELVAEIRSTVESPATRTSNENLGAVIALWRGNNDAALAGVRAGLEAAHTVANDAPPFYVAVLPTWVVDTRQDPPYIVGEETLVLGRRVGAQQARGYLLVTQSIARRLAGDVSGAHSDLDAAATQFCAVGDRYGEAVAINQRGHLLRWTGDLAAARTAFDQAEEIRLALRDPRPMAMTYTGQAFVDALLGDPDSARELASRATELMRRNGDGNGLIIALGNAAMVELALGDTAATLAALDAALDLGRRLAGSKRGVGWLELCRASLVAPTDPVTAMQAIEHSRQRFGEIGEQRGLAALARLAKRLQSATV